jgi:dTDP-4-dehydrorhamnose 3,5-epimerase
MKFTETPLPGLIVIELEPIFDSRGFFARTWCENEFAGRGLCTTLRQSGIAFNRLRGTIRGLHFQRPPFAETKIVRCTAGAILDVAVDLRPETPTYLQYFTIELTARNRTALYIPEGFGHGYQTLEDDTEVAYWMSQLYAPEYAAGIRWNDSALGIQWPLETTEISERDRNLPTVEDYTANVRCART